MWELLPIEHCRPATPPTSTTHRSLLYLSCCPACVETKHRIRDHHQFFSSSRSLREHVSLVLPQGRWCRDEYQWWSLMDSTSGQVRDGGDECPYNSVIATLNSPLNTSFMVANNILYSKQHNVTFQNIEKYCEYEMIVFSSCFKCGNISYVIVNREIYAMLSLLWH